MNRMSDDLQLYDQLNGCSQFQMQATPLSFPGVTDCPPTFPRNFVGVAPEDMICPVAPKISAQMVRDLTGQIGDAFFRGVLTSTVKHV
jgi:hypothetical protein